MIVKCWRCGRKYIRDDVGDYGYPYLCDNCKDDLSGIKEVQEKCLKEQ